MAEPSMAAQVVALTHLSVAELRVRWQEVFGEETSQRNCELGIISQVGQSLVGQLDPQGIYELVGTALRAESRGTPGEAASARALRES